MHSNPQGLHIHTIVRAATHDYFIFHEFVRFSIVVLSIRYKKTAKIGVYHKFLEPSEMSSNYLLCLINSIKPKYIKVFLKKEKTTRQMLTYVKQEPVNIDSQLSNSVNQQIHEFPF